jgi:hypothetical protein
MAVRAFGVMFVFLALAWFVSGSRPAPPGVDLGDFTPLPFDRLPRPGADGGPRRVVLRGYMMPLSVDASGRVTEFTLNGFGDMCAFGLPPDPSQWVHVRMREARPVPFAGHVPVDVYGTLEVGPRVEGRRLTLYRLQGEHVSSAP